MHASKLVVPVVIVLLSSNSAAQRVPAQASGRVADKANGAQFWGFAAPWDAASDASIREHGRQLTVVVTGWIGLDSATGRPLLPSPYVDTVSIRGAATRRMAIVTSWHGDRFHPSSIRTLARDRRRLAQSASTIARYAAAMRYAGLVLDFEELTVADLEAQLAVVRAIADSARARGVRSIAVAVPALDSAAYPARRLVKFVDVVIPMLYDEHWATSKPGPVASPDFVRRGLAMRVAEVGPDRVVAGLPTYGYRWASGYATQVLGTAAARKLAERYRVPLTRDATSGSLRAAGAGWDVWVTDATALQTLVAAAEAHGVRRFALWRLGLEDPAVWGRVIP